MTAIFRKAALAAGVLVAGVAASVSFTGTASASPAAYFPFWECHSQTDYISGNLEVDYDHEQSSPHLYFYRFYRDGVRPDPGNLADSANWASCVPNDN